LRLGRAALVERRGQRPPNRAIEPTSNSWLRHLSAAAHD
jgi:hypothetical protein